MGEREYQGQLPPIICNRVSNGDSLRIIFLPIFHWWAACLKKCDTSSERKIAKSIRLTKHDQKSYTVENEQKCCFWRFPTKGLGVDKGRRITETGKRGNKVVERRRTKFDWQFPWTLFPLFPLFPVVQRLIKFVENVSSRTNIFKNKIVKIEENHSQRPSLHRFHTFCNFLDALASLKTMLDIH